MQLPDRLVIIRQRLHHLACLLELGIHPLDLAPVTRIRKLLRNHAQWNIQCLDITLDRQVHFRRRDGGLLNGTRHQHAHACCGIGDKIGHDLQHRVVEARRRILHAGIKVIMVDERLIVRVGPLRAGPHHVRDETNAIRHHDFRIAVRLDARSNLVMGLGNAPFDCPVDRAFFLGLARMEGLERVGIIMAQHAEGIGGLAPLLLRQQLDRFGIPFGRLVARAAPFAFGNMQDVVLEILERRVRRLGALQKMLVVHQEQRLPLLSRFGVDQVQRIECDMMMCRCAAVRTDNPFQQGHDGNSSVVNLTPILAPRRLP